MDYFHTDDEDTVNWLCEAFWSASLHNRRVRIRTDEKNQLQIKIGGSGWTAPIKSTPDPYREDRERCGAAYGQNPDTCYQLAGHKGSHSNRYGTTWA